MKKILSSLAMIVFLLASFFLFVGEEKNPSLEKFRHAGALIYDEYQDKKFDENDLKFMGTSLVIELEENIDIDLLTNAYLHDVSDENVEVKLAEYRSALKAEYSELRKDFSASFPFFFRRINWKYLRPLFLITWKMRLIRIGI